MDFQQEDLASKISPTSFVGSFFKSNHTIENDPEDKYIKLPIAPWGKAWLIKKLGSKERISAMFNSYGWLGAKMHKFFLPELIALLEESIKPKYRYDVKKGYAKDLLEQLKKDIENIELDIDRKHIDKVFDFKPLPHQEILIKKYLITRKVYELNGMLAHAFIGAGKSLSSIFLAEGLHHEVDKVIIICPLPTVRDVWDKTLSGEPKTGMKIGQSRYIFAGKDGSDYKNEKYIICHYEALDKLQDLLKTLRKTNYMVIVDESHNLSTTVSKRTSLAIDIVKMIEAKHVLLLSGTPVKSGYKELITIFKFLDPKFDAEAEQRYTNLYRSPSNFMSEVLTLRYNGYATIVEKDSVKLEPVVTNHLKIKLSDADINKFSLKNIKLELGAYISNRKRELEANMPHYINMYKSLVEEAMIHNEDCSPSDFARYSECIEIIRSTSPRQLHFIPDELAYVNKFEREQIVPYLDTKEKRDNFKEVKTIYKYYTLKVIGEALGNVIGKARIECHALMARELDYTAILDAATKKTIVFSNYTEVCQSAMEASKKQGYKPIGVFGEETKSLASHVATFGKDPKVNPLVTTYKSLSTGVPLTMADTIICLDMPFRMYIYEQAVGRAWRIGQDKQVHVFILEIDTEVPTINSRNIDIIKFFNAEVEKLTGITSSVSLSTEELEEHSELTVSTEEATSRKTKNAKRIATEDFILKYIKKVVTGKENVELYQELFNNMSDKEFDEFMVKLRDGKATLSVIIPTNSSTIKVDVENNIKLAKELGYDFFQRLNIGATEDNPAYTTPNKYMVLKLPVRRAAQLLSKKISIPTDNRSIDTLSGQVTGKSKGSKITNPELQILLGLNLKDSIKELIRIRGGDTTASTAMNAMLFKTGMATQENIISAAEAATGVAEVTSKTTLRSYFQGMHIRSTL